MSFSVDKPLSRLTFTFALPTEFSNKAVFQNISDLNVKFHPTPSNVSDKVDRFGNTFRTVSWQNLSSDASVTITFSTRVKAEISAMNSKAGFPLRDIPASERIFLEPSSMVQSTADEIVSLAKRLTKDATTEHEAVTAILNFVADSIKYTYNPPEFDALYTLRTKSGNCQNFAHLSMALLRAVGIPARIVGGISLKQPWKAPVSESSFLVQSMGQGGHAWMEIYFPDLGWLSYDPQQSKQFTSSRHIKQTHGLDSMDINDSWQGLPYVPEYNEFIDAKFVSDTISIKPKNFEKAPKSYLFSNHFIAKAETPKEPPKVIVEAKLPPTPPAKPTKPDIETKRPMPSEEPKAPAEAPKPKKPTDSIPEKPAETKKPVDTPKPVETKKPTDTAKPSEPVKPTDTKKPPVEPPKPTKEPPKPIIEAKLPPVQLPPSAPKDIEFGNMDFPNLVDTYQIVGDRGRRILDKETAEYVTSQYVFAQAFEVQDTFKLQSISLAMHKFGGDGFVYIDLVHDKDGKPDVLHGNRSSLVSLESIKRRPGYYWVDFDFATPSRLTLQKGKYWIVLRHSGEAIMNWFYIPGNPYGDADDTRSTLKGYKWEDIQNYDFVFKVKGSY